MKEDKNLHAGHRERTIKNFLVNSDAFSDHQVLEIMLYFVVPRIDTNPLAHRLFNMFGDLDTIFNSSIEQLMSVEGVGKKVATFILATGNMLKRIENKKQKEIYFSSSSITKDFCIKLFDGSRSERFVMLLLDKKFKLISKVEFSDESKSMVRADLPELTKAISVFKPVYIIVAHNHTSGKANPSKEDNYATKKLNLLCELNDVNLIDHVIVADKNVFSYKDENLMEKIKQENSLSNLFGN